MKLIIQDTAHNSIDSAFDYLSRYSIKNAIKTIDGIYEAIYNLESTPFIGGYVPEIPNKQFRQLICSNNRDQSYRIVYYVSESKENIHILYVANCKQDLNRILRIHNYFNNHFDF